MSVTKILMISSCFFLAFGCRGTNPAESGSDVSDLLRGDVDEALEQHLPTICQLAHRQLTEARGSGATSAEQSCNTNLIKLICVLNRESLSEAAAQVSEPAALIEEFAKRRRRSIAETTEYLMDDPKMSPLLEQNGDVAEDIRDLIRQQFRDEIGECLTSARAFHDLEVAKLREEIFANEDASDLRNNFWSYVLKRMFIEDGPRTATTIAQGAVFVHLATKVRGLIGYGLCQAGTAMVASLLPDSASHPNQSACVKMRQHLSTNPLKNPACWRVASDVCGAAIGSIDFKRWGIQPDSETASALVDLASTSAWAACHYSGQAAAAATGGASLSIPLACGVANVAVATMVEQFQTGNNPFAQCAGTDKMGACFGEWMASGGWSSNEGVARPYLTPGSDGSNWVVRRCCKCQKSTYSSGVLVNSIVRQHAYMSVIQDGSFSTGNCRNLERGRHQIDSTHFYRYEQCGDVYVVGDSCHGVSVDDRAFRVRSWDVNARAPGTEIYHQN